MTITATDAATLIAAATASAREIATAAREPIAGIDELLAMDDELEEAASRMIDAGWARSDVRRWIGEGIEAANS